MAGRRHRDFRSGDLNEELGILLLKGVAAVATVPRPEDVGIDAVATLLRDGPEDTLIAENSFYVQFNSSGYRKVTYSGHEVRWLESLKLPFFLGSVRKEDSVLDLYATHRLSQVMLEMSHKEVHLFLDTQDEGKSGPDKRFVNIGPPLLSWSIRDFAKPEFAPWAYSVLKPYLDAEQRNIDYRGIRYIQQILWETGKPPRCQQAHMLFQSGGSNEDILRVMHSMGPHLHAIVGWAVGTKDRHALEMCLQLIEFMRGNGFDPDPGGGYQFLYANWDQIETKSR
jgi:hypothetical protein